MHTLTPQETALINKLNTLAKDFEELPEQDEDEYDDAVDAIRTLISLVLARVGARIYGGEND
jgi:hypothetical protein